MDVTSLLNQSATSLCCKKPQRETTPPSLVFQQDTLTSASLPTPSPERTTPLQDWESKAGKNRTPWSAGGYALPLQVKPKIRSNSIISFRSGSDLLDSDSSVDSLGRGRHSRDGSTDSVSVDMESSQTSLPSARLQQDRPKNREESDQACIETRGPVGHKLSDSHSSLSSYTSWRSRSHSRISSVTTVGGIHSAGPSLTELPLLETTMAPHSESYQTPISAKTAPQSYGGGSSSHNRHGDWNTPKRSGSPSDAVLNMKATAKPLQTEVVPSSDPSPRARRLSGISSSHKRAISAPDPSIVANYSQFNNRRHPRSVLPPPPRMAMAVAGRTNSPTVGLASLMKVGTEYSIPDNESCSETEDDVVSRVSAPKPMRNVSSPDQPVNSPNTSIPLDESQQLVCMFVENCDTGSQLRKAISHLFGRNKSCTKLIPPNLWVSYCRKHYQRIRYRNARTYPITQMELVETQIERLKAWSERNQQSGKGAYIQSWTLSLRKREKKRREGKQGGNEDDEDISALGSEQIPSFITDQLREGHSTDTIFALATRLREEIEKGTLKQVPEIEFLPVIVGGEKDKEKAKATRQPRQNASTATSKPSKRKAPDSPVITRPSPAFNNMSYAGYAHDGGYDTDGIISPSGKRPRTARAAIFPHHRPSEVHVPHLVGPVYNTSPYSNLGSSGPPRAKATVPKIQDITYGHPYPHNVDTGRYAPYGPIHGHVRVASHQGIPGGHDYGHEPYYHPNVPNYAQAPVPFSSSQSSPNSPPTLPSIAPRTRGADLSYQRRDRALPRAYMSGSSRPMHQRSTSEYTLSRPGFPFPGRPTSSGDSNLGEHDRYEAGGQAPPPPAVYDARHHEPPSSAGGELRHHQYDGRSGWAPSYEQAAPYHGHHPCHQYATSPSYTPSAHVDTNAYIDAAADKNGKSVYPEPKGPSGTRSA